MACTPCRIPSFRLLEPLGLITLATAPAPPGPGTERTAAAAVSGTSASVGPAAAAVAPSPWAAGVPVGVGGVVVGCAVVSREPGVEADHGEADAMRAKGAGEAYFNFALVRCLSSRACNLEPHMVGVTPITCMLTQASAENPADARGEMT